jgi:hypothetical protein
MLIQYELPHGDDLILKRTASCQIFEVDLKAMKVKANILEKEDGRG